MVQVRSLRQLGIKVGRGAYIDAEWVGEPGIVRYEDGAVADRGAIVFGHLMVHDGNHYRLRFNNVSIGPEAQVATRAAVLPGVALKPKERVAPARLVMSM